MFIFLIRLYFIIHYMCVNFMVILLYVAKVVLTY